MCQGTFDDPVCDADETCLVANDGQLTLCLPTCDPIDSTCGDGFGCYPSRPDGFVCLREGENVHTGDLFHAYCPPGSFMAEDGCVAFCDLTVDEGCEGEATCQPYFERASAPRGLEHVGVCAVGGAR